MPLAVALLAALDLGAALIAIAYASMISGRRGYYCDHVFCSGADAIGLLLVFGALGILNAAAIAFLLRGYLGRVGRIIDLWLAAKEKSLKERVGTDS